MTDEVKEKFTTWFKSKYPHLVITNFVSPERGHLPSIDEVFEAGYNLAMEESKSDKQLAHYVEEDVFFQGYTKAQEETKPRLTECEKALEDLLSGEDEECRFDHQNNCQNHNYFNENGECNVARAREYFAKWRKE